MASHVIRTVAELGSAVTLSPERFRVAGLGARGVPLGELVRERLERLSPDQAASGVVLDTTHAKDGLLDLASAARAGSASRSSKKRVLPGDLLVSRLRPYLRQIALAHPSVFLTPNARRGAARLLACSTEFYVLAARAPGESLAYLLPFLLSDGTQAALAAGQEGGQHPRVPRDTLLALRVPHAVVRQRRRRSAAIEAALRRLHEARIGLNGLLDSVS